MKTNAELFYLNPLTALVFHETRSRLLHM